MGQKVNPNSQRLKINELWKSRWISNRDYSSKLIGDIKLRDEIMRRYKNAAVLDVIIMRDPAQLTVNIYSARPGVMIGRGGSGSEKIKKVAEDITKTKSKINIVEVKNPDSSSGFIAQNIAYQLEKRMPFRRTLKQAIEKARDNVKGIKIEISGRLNGADIARTEKANWGSVPLSAFKSNIDYAFIAAVTTFGVIGVKVWVYLGKKEFDMDIYNNEEK